MRSWLSCTVACAVALTWAAAPAKAASVAVTGQFEAIVVGLDSVVVPLGPGTTVDVSGGTVTIPAGIASIDETLPITGFPLDLITGLTLNLTNGAGSFTTPGPSQGAPAAVPGGAFGGVMAISGAISTTGLVELSFNLTVAGVGGSQNEGDIILYGAPWTAGQAVITLSDDTELVLAGSQTGALGAIGSQTVLVTPLLVDALGLYEIPVFGRLTLNFVPEPGTGLLLAAGVAALGAARRRSPRQ